MGLIFFADVPPDFSDESLRLYGKCGFDAYLMTEDYIRYDDDPVKYIGLLEKLNKDGVKVIMRGYNDGKTVPDYFKKFAKVNFYNYDNIIGFYIVDEPAVEQMDALRDYAISLYAPYSDLFWHINLLPSYTPAAALSPMKQKDLPPFEYYLKEYVEKVVNNVSGTKHICFDHYALFEKDSIPYVSDTWLYDLFTVANVAKKSGAKTGACVQAFSDSGWRILRSADEIRFQLYTFLAFGVSVFEFYHYCPLSGYPNAVPLSINGKPTDVYDYCESAIKEIKKVQDNYCRYKWQGVYLKQGNGVGISANFVHIENGICSEFGVKRKDGKNPAFEKIADKTLKALKMMTIESEKDVIVGEFVNADGGYAYMIVNFVDPAIKEENNAAICFLGGKKVVSLTDKGSTVKFSESEFSIKLKPGDGLFLEISGK